MTEIDEQKRAVGYETVDTYVRDGTCVGLGTGTTAFWAITRVGERVAQGWDLAAVTTSAATEALCRERRIPVVGLLERRIDVAIDGADEVDPQQHLIKGGGGALFREKAVALVADRFVVIVTKNKLVDRLGAFPLPVEVVPYAVPYVARELIALGASVTVRAVAGGRSYISDNGNAIFDCGFGFIDDPERLDAQLKAIHGVVATGLFVGLADEVVVR